MARRLFVFEQPDRFLAAAVGSPGDRTFYLQARQGGALVTMSIEKTQVAALAQRIGELLVAMRAQGETVTPGAPAELERPLVELFRVGALSLAWDGEAASLIVEARPLSEDGAYPDVSDDDPNGPDLVRVTLDASAAHRFAVGAAAAVAAGRPLCPFCGQPLDASGHFCPRMNGHLN